MKTLTIIKAIGAGVTALYLGGKVAHLTQTTDSRTHVEDETAQQWSYTVDEFLKALEDLLTDRGPLKLRKGATDLNYGGDAS